MNNRYVAIYSTCLFPQSNEDIVNKEFSSIEDAKAFLERKDNMSAWNKQIYDKEIKEYIR